MPYARFTQDEKERTKEAVLAYERMSIGAPENTDKAKGYSPRQFWARITGSDGSGYYSWEQLKPDDVGWIQEDPDQEYPTGDYSEDENWAVEATGSVWVLNGDVVWMRGAETYPYYVFQYAPGVKMAHFTGTISAGDNSAPGTGDATVYSFDGSSYVNGQSMTVYNPWSTELDSTNTPEARIQLSFGDGVWWVSGANCEEDSTGGT